MVTALPLEVRQLSSLLGSSDTASDVDNGKCAGTTLIFARGTTEPGTLGMTVGPALSSALKTALNNDLAVQGVDYPASILGNVDGGTAGGKTMAALMTKAKSQCAKTKIVLGGYSQGAMVATKAGAAQPQDVTAVVLFGNPCKLSSSLCK